MRRPIPSSAVTQGPAQSGRSRLAVVSRAMTMRDLGRNIAVSVSGVVGTVACGHFAFVAIFLGFENPHPPLFARLGALWVLLYAIIMLGIGFFATRMAVLQSAVVVIVGSIIETEMDYSPLIAPGSVFFPLAAIPAYVRGTLVLVAISCVLTYVGVWLRRVNQRRRRNRDAPC